MLSPFKPFVPGTLVHDRYLVSEKLGGGGSSIVYRVSDTQQENPDTEDTNFALKVLRGTDKHERVQLAFEGQVLKRLEHPTLPHIYDVYRADTADQSDFLVLEYIEGSDLETLRRKQPQKRFTLAETMQFIQPIVEATIYLHHQQPPIIHRDIKPANILIAARDRRVVLIDFGIAKEYEADGTTNAIRQCTPGYGAPEQYGGVGTGPHTDIYALAATCYCLLTGTIPVDALQRTTTIVSQQIDPLKPVSELVPELPHSVTETLKQARAINYERRFTSVENFWSALQGSAAQEDVPVRNTTDMNTPGAIPLPARTKKSRQHFSEKKGTMLALLCLLFTGSLGVGYLSYAHQSPQLMDIIAAIQPIHHTSTTKKTVMHTQPTATAQIPYAQLAKTYRGTLYNLLTHNSSIILLSDIQQNQQSLHGRFTGMKRTENFTGVIDASNHILLTIPASAGNPPLFFEGVLRSDKNIAGDYCNQDQAGQCIDNYGLWSLAPS